MKERGKKSINFNSDTTLKLTGNHCNNDDFNFIKLMTFDAV